MRKSINAYVQGIAHDNSEFIVNGSESIADYIIQTAENGTGYEDFLTTTSLMRQASQQMSRLTSWRTTWMRTTIIYQTFAMVSVESCFAISSTLTSSSQSLTGRRQKRIYQCYWMMRSVCSRMATALCGLTTTTTLSTRPRISFRAIEWSSSSGTRKR